MSQHRAPPRKENCIKPQLRQILNLSHFELAKMFLKKKGYWILGTELTWHSAQENLFWLSIVVTDLYLIYYNILLQNVICIITKSDNHNRKIYKPLKHDLLDFQQF